MIKSVILFLLFAYAATVVLCAQEQTDWQKKAITKYPELAIKDSFTNKAFIHAYKDLQEHYPDILQNPDSTYILAVALDRAIRTTKSISTPEAAAFMAVQQLVALKNDQQAGAYTVGSFLSIPWGASRNQTILTVKERRNASYNDVSDIDEKQLIFDGGDYAGIPTKTISFQFSKGGMYSGTATIESSDNNKIWRQIIDNLTQKYGQPISVKNEDGLFNEKILWCRWYFPTSLQRQESIQCGKYSIKGKIAIHYTNETMQNESLKEFEQDEKARQQREQRDY